MVPGPAPPTRLHSWRSRDGKACLWGEPCWAMLGLAGGVAGLAGLACLVWVFPTGKCQAGGHAPSRLDAEVHEKKGVIRCRVVQPRFPFPSCLQKPIPNRQLQSSRFERRVGPWVLGEGPIASGSRCTASTGPR